MGERARLWLAPFHKLARPLAAAACLALAIPWVRAERAAGAPPEPQLEGKNGEELRKVRAVIEEALKTDAGNSELWVHLGLVERKLERVDLAQAAFERGASLNPRNANAHFMLGLIYEKKKLTERAIAAWEACRAAAGDEKMREIADKHIGLLRGP